MKRALAAIVGTIAGLIVLLDFKTHPAGQSTQTPIAATAPSVPVPGTPAAASAVPSETPSASAPAAKTAPAPQPQKRTVTGSSVRTPYGNVEVQVVFTGTQITDVVPLRLPDSNGVDQEIDQQAVPILIQETLTAQSANIQAVSGASYTSDGYIRSLQSALDKAK